MPSSPGIGLGLSQAATTATSGILGHMQGQAAGRREERKLGIEEQRTEILREKQAFAERFDLRQQDFDEQIAIVKAATEWYKTTGDEKSTMDLINKGPFANKIPGFKVTHIKKSEKDEKWKIIQLENGQAFKVEEGTGRTEPLVTEKAKEPLIEVSKGASLYDPASKQNVFTAPGGGGKDQSFDQAMKTIKLITGQKIDPLALFMMGPEQQAQYMQKMVERANVDPNSEDGQRLAVAWQIIDRQMKANVAGQQGAAQPGQGLGALQGGGSQAPAQPDYDYESALKAGLGPNETGHWPSRDPKTGLILKSETHPTFNKTIQGEEAAGNEIYRNPDDNRLYSRPKGGSPTSQDKSPEQMQQLYNQFRQQGMSPEDAQNAAMRANAQ